ncbi:GNAT family N-acetyltransferase [Halorutilales archaeon Cl-col2-1]
MEVIEYSPDLKSDWDSLVEESTNGTFMFKRDYMEYHSDRFNDHSLLIHYKGSPIAVFPANQETNTLVSHAGLTFGGLIGSEKLTTNKTMDAFQALEEYLINTNINKIQYKAIPTIYHDIPSEGDRYALFRKNAELYRRDVSSAIDLERGPSYKDSRSRSIDSAVDAGVKVKETTDYKSYWNILIDNLQERHDTEPVHSLEEIRLLHNRFPDNIRLFGAFLNGDIVSGVVVYESDVTARTQYIAGTDQGRDVRATDYLFDQLINEHLNHKRYIDFGISTEQAGSELNEGLIYYKESFGARPVVHDFFEWSLEN